MRRSLDFATGLASVALVAASTVAGVSLARGFYADAGSNVVAGAVLGAMAGVTASVIFGIIAARANSAVDPHWAFTTARVGVEGGALWFYRHRTLIVFRAQGAFVDLARSDDLILAFINRVTAYGFPRRTLAATSEGREVLDWFDAHWPARSDAGPAPETMRQALRRGLRRIWRICWKVMVLLGIIAFVVALADWATDRRPRIPERDWGLPGRTRSGMGEGSALPALSGRGVADSVIHVPDR